MARRTIVYIALPGLVVAGILYSSCGDSDYDHSLSVRPGGELSVDIELGSGVSFDRGSLEITSHEADEVRVIADVSGWGGYAVDLDVTEHDGDVKVVGRVDGFMHWAFGGPTVDVRISVPRDYSIAARIDGGPLLLEDLTGPVVARVEGSEIALRRSEGEVRLSATGGDVEVEDVEGSLSIDSRGGDVSVSGVRGDLIVRTARGSIEIESVKGRVDVATERGRIKVEDLDGRIDARSGRGGVQVEFSGDPAGRIETERGTIEVEIAGDAAFDLDAYTRRGEIELDEDFELAIQELPDVAAPPDWATLGQKMATEVRDKLSRRLRENLDRGMREGNWEKLDWNFEWTWDDGSNGEGPDWPWGDHDVGWGRSDRDWSRAGRHGESLAGEVNGGGETLTLRTQRGDVEIEER